MTLDEISKHYEVPSIKKLRAYGSPKNIKKLKILVYGKEK
jgi:protein involved in ribonucleotide reduction